MTINEVIKRLTDIANEKWNRDELKGADAVQLSIEALKRIEAGRLKGYDYFGHLLPGETEQVK